MNQSEAFQQLNLSEDLLPVGNLNRPGLAMSPDHITIHNTANPARSANSRMHAKYMKGSAAQQRKVSWHYTVDDREVIKHLPILERAFHAGTREGNRRSIGIEICEFAGIDQAAANDRAALLTAVLLHSLALDITAVVPHRHWSGKFCPHLLLENNEAGWHEFVDRVRLHLEGLTVSRQDASQMAGRAGVTFSQPDGEERVLDALPDVLDFRDLLFRPLLNEVPESIPLDTYQNHEVPILDQGKEGACTGFALSTVIHYLLRISNPMRNQAKVSPRMIYEMARRYDEWPGENYSGSSARGAMKGWHKHGVCREDLWPYSVLDPLGDLDPRRAQDAQDRPLGAYYRVNHQDLVAMHSALAQVGVLYATGTVHRGWQNTLSDGQIVPASEVLGGHAFAIVAYDRQGFWIQNSWGSSWGKSGFGHLRYEDWFRNGSDVWVARLGVPVDLRSTTESGSFSISLAGQSMVYSELRPHVVSLGNNGQLETTGTYGNNAAQVEQIVEKEIPQIMSQWTTPRLAVYAHGGLTPETSALQHLADWRGQLLPEEVCPLAVIWHTDIWSTLSNILQDAIRSRRPEGFLDKAMDFMLDRLDDMIEPVARGIGGKAMWDEMKENAILATVDGGLETVATGIASLANNPELHLVGHSAGSILHGPFAQLLATTGTIQQGPLAGRRGLGKTIESLTLWAPAITVSAFKTYYLPLLRSGRIKRFALYTLSDELERDDNCLSLYHKSLLYLVSNAFEDGRTTPILGMERFVNADPEIHSLFRPGTRHVWVRSGIDVARSNAHQHGDFDDDPHTLQSTLAWIKNQWRDQGTIGLPVTFSSPTRQAYRRQGLARAIGVTQPSSLIK